MTKKKPKQKISVLLVTFNHELYIKHALISLFDQNFNGPIELVIADDASLDNTLTIIKEFENIDSRFNFVFLENKINIGITKNYERGFKACSSAYIAVLEGDDYWISPYKLSKQYDFLEQHWECDLCANNYYIFNEVNSEFQLRINTNEKEFQLISAQDLIIDNIVGNFSTCMYRKSKLESLPIELFEIKSYDWIINICVAKNSFIGFLNEPLSVYRLHLNGSWSSLTNKDKVRQIIEIIPKYDQLTNLAFHDTFMKLVNSYNNIKISDVKKDFIPPILLLIIKLLIPPFFLKLALKLYRKI